MRSKLVRTVKYALKVGLLFGLRLGLRRACSLGRHLVVREFRRARVGSAQLESPSTTKFRNARSREHQRTINVKPFRRTSYIYTSMAFQLPAMCNKKISPKAGHRRCQVTLRSSLPSTCYHDYDCSIFCIYSLSTPPFLLNR